MGGGGVVAAVLRVRRTVIREHVQIGGAKQPRERGSGRQKGI